MKILASDILAFLAANHAYIEWGEPRTIGSGYARFDEDAGGWDAHVYRGGAHESLAAADGDPEFRFATLPDALSAAVEDAQEQMRRAA